MALEHMYRHMCVVVQWKWIIDSHTILSSIHVRVGYNVSKVFFLEHVILSKVFNDKTIFQYRVMPVLFFPHRIIGTLNSDVRQGVSAANILWIFLSTVVTVRTNFEGCNWFLSIAHAFTSFTWYSNNVCSVSRFALVVICKTLAKAAILGCRARAGSRSLIIQIC